LHGSLIYNISANAANGDEYFPNVLQNDENLIVVAACVL
jgi:hypothetical protein